MKWYVTEFLYVCVLILYYVASIVPLLLLLSTGA